MQGARERERVRVQMKAKGWNHKLGFRLWSRSGLDVEDGALLKTHHVEGHGYVWAKTGSTSGSRHFGILFGQGSNRCGSHKS